VPVRAGLRGAPEEREKWSNEHQRMFGYRPKSASGAGRWRRGRRRRRRGQLQEARVGLERGAELDEWPALLVKSLEGSSAPSAPPRKPMRSFSASHTTHYRGTDCTN